MPDEASPAAPVTTTAPAPATPPAAAQAAAPAQPAASAPSSSAAPSSSLNYEEALKGFEDAGLPAGQGIAQPKKPAAAATAVEPVAPNAGPRAEKLSQITDLETREALTKMSNKAFDKFHDIALKLQNGEYVPRAELVALETKANEAKQLRYFDHEEGYKLTPEYRAIESKVNLATGERDFWAHQLAAAHAGQPVQWLNPPNDKGEITVGTEQYDPKANPNIIAQINKNMTSAEIRLQGLSGEIGKLPAQHKTEYTKFTTGFSQTNDALFKNVTNPVFKSKFAAHMKTVPAALQGRPEVILACNALAAGEIFYAQNTELKAEIARLKSSNSGSPASAPAPIDTGGSGEVNTDRAAVNRLHQIATGNVR